MSKKGNQKPQTKDESPHVYQRDKIAANFNIKELKWTDKQKLFIERALDKETKILFVNGPAGSAKTLLSVYSALRLLNEKRVSDIIYIRSAVESSDSKLGFLPGDADEKLHFYNLPFLEKMDELLPRAEVDKLEKDKRISMYPVNYARGMSWSVKCIIFDEAQNSTQKEIVTVLTRLGQFSKCFVLADPQQTDLPVGRGGAFERMYDLFSDEDSQKNGVFTFKLDEEDILRSELTKFLVKKIKNIK
jgi:phosphate starvation-inducible PhoH-like protein